MTKMDLENLQTLGQDFFMVTVITTEFTTTMSDGIAANNNIKYNGIVLCSLIKLVTQQN